MACDLIQIFALRSNDGHRCVAGARLRSVWLGRLLCCSFLIATRLRTNVVCTNCYGNTVNG